MLQDTLVLMVVATVAVLRQCGVKKLHLLGMGLEFFPKAAKRRLLLLARSKLWSRWDGLLQEGHPP